MTEGRGAGEDEKDALYEERKRECMCHTGSLYSITLRCVDVYNRLEGACQCLRCGMHSTLQIAPILHSDSL